WRWWSGSVGGAPQIDWERLVRLLVEAKLGHRAGLVPAGIVVVARGLVQAELHVLMRPNPFGSVDYAPLEGGVNVGGGSDHRRAARLGNDLAAERRTYAHLQPLEVADRGDFLSEPSGHLRAVRRSGTRHEVEGGIRLLLDLEPASLRLH